MGQFTEIAWTDHTFNPWIGCTKVSPGCANCYAKTRDDRHMLGPASHWGPGAPRHITSLQYWREPQKWARVAFNEGRRHKVFTASQADIFDAEASTLQRRQLWAVIESTHEWLDWQIVTKGPERICDVMKEDGLNRTWFEQMNCWLITSTENQEYADKRIPELLRIPAAVHGISAEPLLGPINLRRIDYRSRLRDVHEHICRLTGDSTKEAKRKALAEIPEGDLGEGNNPYIDVLSGEWFDGWDGGSDGAKIDWVIVGGESGMNARPMHPDWVRSLRDQCENYAAFFFKQWGEWSPYGTFPVGTLLTRIGGGLNEYQLGRVGKKTAGAQLDGREWREFPEAVRA